MQQREATVGPAAGQSADPRLRVTLPRGVVLRDPVLISSGVQALGEAPRPGATDPRKHGGIITTALTRERREGNPGVKIRPLETGWLNSKGLRNPGSDAFVSSHLLELETSGVGFFVNLVGESPAGFAELVMQIDTAAEPTANDPAQGRGLLGYELNLSCPNVDKTMFATDTGLIEETVRLCRSATERLLVVKLSPNVGDMRPFAAAAQSAGADAVTIANTFNALDIDVQTRRSRFHRPSAGYSGPGVRPIVLYHVWQVRSELPELPIFGSGGIVDTDSALQYLLAGASVLLVGSAIFKNPGLPEQLQRGLRAYLDEHGVAEVKDLVGTFDPTLSA